MKFKKRAIGIKSKQKIDTKLLKWKQKRNHHMLTSHTITMQCESRHTDMELPDFQSNGKSLSEEVNFYSIIACWLKALFVSY